MVLSYLSRKALLQLPKTGKKTFWIDQICIYQDRYRTKCSRNLRFEPLFCNGVGFACLACPVHTHELFWAPWSWFGILYNQESVCNSDVLSEQRARRDSSKAEYYLMEKIFVCDYVEI
jgi:hypothetical protein